MQIFRSKAARRGKFGAVVIKRRGVEIHAVFECGNFPSVRLIYVGVRVIGNIRSIGSQPFYAELIFEKIVNAVQRAAVFAAANKYSRIFIFYDKSVASEFCFVRRNIGGIHKFRSAYGNDFTAGIYAVGAIRNLRSRYRFHIFNQLFRRIFFRFRCRRRNHHKIIFRFSER